MLLGRTANSLAKHREYNAELCWDHVMLAAMLQSSLIALLMHNDHLMGACNEHLWARQFNKSSCAHQ